MRNLTVAAVQMESAIGGVDANMRLHDAYLERAAQRGCDLVFFPECSVTGYSTDMQRAAVLKASDERLVRLETRAFELGMAVGYGFLESCPGTDWPFVTYAVASDGGRLTYRKTHLGSRECAVFSAGDTLPVSQVLGVDLGVALCWEAHLPDVVGTLRAQGAQLVLVPHASGMAGARRLELWGRYLPARAYDNGLFVVACNALLRAKDGKLRGGGLAAYGPDGMLVEGRASEQDDMLVVEVGGVLPREKPLDSMHGASFFDRRRPELYL